MKIQVILGCILFSVHAFAQSPVHQAQPTKIMQQSSMTDDQRAELYKIVEELSAEVQSDSTATQKYEMRAKLYFVLKEYKEAISDYDFLIAKNPISAQLYYSRGLSKLAANDIFNACDDFKKAKDLNYDFGGGELLLLCR